MRDFFSPHTSEIFISIAVLIGLLLLRLILTTTANKVGKRQGINVARVRLMVKYINILMIFIAIFLLMIVWGVRAEQLSLVFSSVFAVIGIGLFAVWSILSNITSGIIMFFSFPYKIGDKIKIHDADVPLEGIIEDIKAFHVYLRIPNGELVTYPNNLVLQKAISLVKKDAFVDDGSDSL